MTGRDKFGFLTLASLCLGATILTVIEERENHRLRLQLSTEHAGSHADVTRNVSANARRDSSQPRPDAGGARLTVAEIEPALQQMVQSRLWRKGTDEARRILGRIDAKDMPKALESTDRYAAGEARRILRIILLNAWAKLDPPAAAAWLKQFPATEAQRAERVEISDVWAQTDPEAALAFAGPTPGAFRSLALRAPEEAARKALEVRDEGSGRASSIETVAKAWFENDPKAAWNWASALPDSQDRFVAVRPLIGPLAEVDPASVARYLATMPKPPFNSLAEDFADQWAGVDPVAAAAWAASLPANSASRAGAIIQIAQVWAEDDPHAAVAWLESLPKGRDRETAIQVFANRTLNFDPALAADWAVKLADQTARGEVIANVALRWLHADRPAAEAWLAQIDVPENARKRLSSEGFPLVSGGAPPP